LQRLQPWIHCGRVLVGLAIDLVWFVEASLRSRTALAAATLFLRKQLALYGERQVKPWRASDPLRLTPVILARCFAWRDALTIVQPATLVRWHRNAFRLFWCCRSRPGRPRLPAELQQLIAAMARDNVTWGEERIARLSLVIRRMPRHPMLFGVLPVCKGYEWARTAGPASSDARVLIAPCRERLAPEDVDLVRREPGVDCVLSEHAEPIILAPPSTD